MILTFPSKYSPHKQRSVSNKLYAVLALCKDVFALRKMLRGKKNQWPRLRYEKTVREEAIQTSGSLQVAIRLRGEMRYQKKDSP